MSRATELANSIQFAEKKTGRTTYANINCNKLHEINMCAGVPTCTGKTGKSGKMSKVFPVREKSGNFKIISENQGKLDKNNFKKI